MRPESFRWLPTYICFMIRSYWDKIPSVFKNRYVATVTIFFIWMLFFDQNDIFSQMQLKSELTQVQTDKAYFESEITRTEEDLEDLMTNDEKLEKFAREKYLMKKSNEELFVIVVEQED